MTKAITKQAELMREALATLSFIEVMEQVGLTNDKYYFEQKTKYSELMAKITTNCLDTVSNEELDQYMQSLPNMVINGTANGLFEQTPQQGQSKEGMVQDSKLFFEHENK
jgi:hypothetical protein